jgi:hypothetical protein
MSGNKGWRPPADPMRAIPGIDAYTLAYAADYGPVVYLYHLSDTEHYVGYSAWPALRWSQHYRRQTGMSRSAARRGLTPIFQSYDSGNLEMEAHLQSLEPLRLREACSKCTRPGAKIGLDELAYATGFPKPDLEALLKAANHARYHHTNAGGFCDYCDPMLGPYQDFRLPRRRKSFLGRLADWIAGAS